ncbi:hypothetical protein ANTQUA_LOCUS6332 [Anthophora quadrimaculata]
MLAGIIWLVINYQRFSITSSPLSYWNAIDFSFIPSRITFGRDFKYLIARRISPHRSVVSVVSGTISLFIKQNLIRYYSFYCYSVCSQSSVREGVGETWRRVGGVYSDTKSWGTLTRRSWRRRWLVGERKERR